MSKAENELEQFTVFLSSVAHEIAQQQIEGIANRLKAKQVYANTLAVYAVNYYLQCLGFEPDWEHSNSRDRLLVQLANIADLKIKNIGSIECVPILTDLAPENINLHADGDSPMGTLDNRIGWMPVRIDRDLKTATILGFSPQTSGELKSNELKDLEYAIEYLTKIERPVTVKLREWLHGLVDSAWEPLDRVLNPQQLRLHYRGAAVNRGQKIDLHAPTGNIPSTLVIDVKSIDRTEKLDVLVQVYPRDRHELPAGIELTISDDNNTTLTAISQAGDNWIQLNFIAIFDEEFTVKVGFDGTEIVKNFAI
jgi:hypothetical protein